jgi:Glycosyl transferases group 1
MTKVGRYSSTNAPRLAVVVQGDPTSPRTWSGTPSGIVRGLASLGVKVVPIDATPPGAEKVRTAMRRHWTWEATNPLAAAASSLRANLHLRRVGKLDGVIAIGSGFLLRTRTPVVTFDDETIAQALSQELSELELNRQERRRWMKRQQQAFLESRACCVGSDWVASSIREDYGVDPDKVRIVGFGHNIQAEPTARDWSTPHFLMLAVKWNLKRGPAVLEAFAKVRERYPEATIEVAGKHPPLDAPGVTGHGMLNLGSPDDRARLLGLLSRATCHVMPSYREAFGIAYVDAGSAGVPSIGTTVGGAPETIGGGGLVVDPGDDDGLVAAMLELAKPEVAQEMGRRAQERAAIFNWQKVAERMLRALAPAEFDIDDLADYVTPERAERYSSSDLNLRSAR